ncbi:hypothetical protein [Gordonia sihwensis]|uniref:hypothetical protein n=1 Tax=Gordonia sihwensis TaxID=173559 RepID=UPI003D98FC5C
MRITIQFTDVYDGHEYERTETHDLPVAPDVDHAHDDLVDEWADAHIRPLTGTGQRHSESGYFAEVLTCTQRPYLVGHEFSWGV